MSALKVAGYVRCSSQEQAADGMSLDAQQGRIEAWCEATGALLTGWVIDAGVSGSLPIRERPGGAEIAKLLAARSPGVDAVVVVRLDRLGRDAAETLACLKQFSTGRVGLVSIADRLDLSTPQGRAMAGVAAVFGELERGLIAERTSDALARLRAQKRVYGRIPFGYDAEEDRLIDNKDEQRVLARIRRMRSRGMSYERIAGGLNRDGVPAKRGGQWYAMSVRNVLRTTQQLQAPCNS